MKKEITKVQQALQRCTDNMDKIFQGNYDKSRRITWIHDPMTQAEMQEMFKWFDDNWRKLNIPVKYVDYIQSCNAVCFYDK